MDTSDPYAESLVPKIAYAGWLVMGALAQMANGGRLVVASGPELASLTGKSRAVVDCTLDVLAEIGYLRPIARIATQRVEATGREIYELDIERWAASGGVLAPDLLDGETAPRVRERLLLMEKDRQTAIGDRMVSGAVGRTKRASILARDGHRCRYCGAPDPSTLDHVLPAGRGGGNSMANLVAACSNCNSAKACRTPEEAGMTLLPPAGACPAPAP